MHTTAHMLPTQRGSEYRTDQVFQWSSIKVMTIIIPVPDSDAYFKGKELPETY